MSRHIQSISLVLLCSLAAIPLLSQSLSQGIIVDKGLDLFTQPMRINAGASMRQPIQADKPSILMGQVKARGGSGHDIQLQVWYGDRIIFNSGQRHIFDVNVELPSPGTYLLVFDNSFSLVSSKLVWHDLRVVDTTTPATQATKEEETKPASVLSYRQTVREVLGHLASEEKANPIASSVDTESSRPDRWRTLVLNLATPNDAISVLGSPRADKTDRIKIRHVEDHIKPMQKEKFFQNLVYKRLEGFDTVTLSFLSGKLVLVDLDFKDEIPYTNLGGIYGVQFVPFARDKLEVSPQDETGDFGDYFAIGVYSGHIIVANLNSYKTESVENTTVSRLQLISNYLVKEGLDQPKGTGLLQ